MKGYIGKVLIVDLDTETTNIVQIPDEVYENVLSGVGLGAYMMYRMIPAGADPLGPDNVLGFTSGLSTGTGSFMTGRWMAICKSPLTGGIGEANCGGNFSPAIKQCGYDAIFFRGKAKKPVYLYADNKGAELRDASHLWGKDGVTAENELHKECAGRKKPRVAVIGEAAENMSLISGIINDGGRIAARSGVGAVMGSKNLKAVVLAGTKAIKSENQEEVHKLSQGFADFVNEFNLPGFIPVGAFRVNGIMTRRNMMRGKDEVHEHDQSNFLAGIMKFTGTSGGYEMFAESGDSPVKNWTGTHKDISFRATRALGGGKIRKTETKKYHCYGCAVGCGGICDIKNITNGEFTHTHKPEYETQGLLGSMILNGDFKSFMTMNELLNRAGMDTIAAGGTVAFAMECYENGILTKEDTDGLELNFGNSKAALALLRKMIKREGFGDLLADGPKAAAEKIGKGSEAYAMTAGGQPLPAHDGRYSPLLAIQYCADPTPGKHTGSGGGYPDLFIWEKAESAPKPDHHMRLDEFKANELYSSYAAYASCLKMLTDGMGGCTFAMEMNVKKWPIFEYLNANTGWDLSGDEIMTIGKRMQTLRQMFNIKHGIMPKDYFIHRRLRNALPDGATKGRSLDELDGMVSYYWKFFGWDEGNGVPTDATVNALGLDSLLEKEVAGIE